MNGTKYVLTEGLQSGSPFEFEDDDQYDDHEETSENMDAGCDISQEEEVEEKVVPEKRAAALAPPLPAAEEFADDGGNILTKTVTLSFTGSLADLQSKTVQPVLKCANPNMDKIFGGTNVTVLTITALGSDNEFPVGMGIKATGRLAQNAMEHSTITSSGEYLFEAPRKAAVVFAEPQLVFKCQPCNYKRRMQGLFPDVDENNLMRDVKESTVPGFYLLKSNSAILPAIKDMIAIAKEKAKKKNTEYNGPKLERIGQINSFSIDSESVHRAVNMTQKLYAATEDKIHIGQDLTLEFSRAHLSPVTIQAMSAADAPKWTDSMHVQKPGKSGNDLDRKFTLSVKVGVRYLSGQ